MRYDAVSIFSTVNNENPKKLQIKFNWKIALCVVFAFALLLKLGFWQLGRAEEKRQFQRTVESRQLASPTSIENLVTQDPQALKYLRVSMDGSYINEKLILIRNKVHHGRFGFEVISPFKLKSNSLIVLVSRGWIAAEYGKDKIPEIELIFGEQPVVAEIFVPVGKSFFLPEPVHGREWPLILHHFNIADLGELFNTPIFPYLVRLTQDNQGVLKRFWPSVRTKPGTNISYAIQWFGMAIILLAVTIVSSTNIVDLIRSK